MLDIHALTAQMVLYQDYRLLGRGTRTADPHKAALRLYSLLETTSKTQARQEKRVTTLPLK